MVAFGARQALMLGTAVSAGGAAVRRLLWTDFAR